MRLTKEVKETKKEETKKDLELILELFERNSKTSGNKYYTGETKEGTKFVGFITELEEDDKRPYLNIYVKPEENNKFEDAVIVLWKQISQKGNEYLSGHDNENKKVIAFFDETPDTTVPAIRVYYK